MAAMLYKVLLASPFDHQHTEKNNVKLVHDHNFNLKENHYKDSTTTQRQ